MSTERESNDVQVAIRLSSSWLERRDKLAERMSQPGIKLTRTDLHRAALHRGIEVLESEGKKR